MPRIRAPAVAKIRRVRSSPARDVKPLAVTNNTPSARFARIAASVTASTGGESITTHSKRAANTLSKMGSLSEASSFTGLAGTGPDGSTQRLGSGAY